MALRFEAEKELEEAQRALDAVLLRYAETSKESYLRAWKRWSEFADPAKATALDANRFIDEIARAKIQTINSQSRGLVPSRATVQKLVLVLYSLHKQIGEALQWPRNPFEALRRDYKNLKIKQRRPTQMLDYEKVMQLVEAPLEHGPCGLRDAAFLAVIFGAGLRISEACKLNVGDVMPKGKLTVLELRETKNGDDVETPLPHWASVIVLKLIKDRDANEPLFVDYTRHYTSQGRRATRSTMYKRFKFWAKRLGLPSNLSPHAARATAITNLLDSGLDHRTVQEFSRHKSISMVERYDKRRTELNEHPAISLSYSKKTIAKTKI